LIFQVPVTLPLFVDYPDATEPSNNLGDGDEKPAGEDKVGQTPKIIRDEEIGDDDIELEENDIVENAASEMTKSDAKINATKPGLSAHQAKLTLIKDANSAITEMKKYLTKTAVKSQYEESTHEIREDHLRNNVEHNATVDEDEKVVSSNSNPPPSSGVWEAVRILSEKTGLVSSDEGFINIKPLVNLTVNTFGFFDDVTEDKDKPFDPNDTKTVLKSIFQIWNPRVSLVILLSIY
jgi:FlaG/FlaF family flagellin (archaellin)